MQMRCLSNKICAVNYGLTTKPIRERNQISKRGLSKYCKAQESPGPVNTKEEEEQEKTSILAAASESDSINGGTLINVKDVDKIAKKVATTFAPRASGKNLSVAFKGSLLYEIFGWQAWITMAIGGLLSFNIIFPSDTPSISRLLGMWSIWIFTIPSLRARECTAAEKDALNILFLLIPIVNVTLPFVWKSFPFVYTADVITMGAVYYWKLTGKNEENE